MSGEAIRVGDADRERTIERLRQAAAEGRLEPDELEERVGSALAARTGGDLTGLVEDLPSARRPRRRRRRRAACVTIAWPSRWPRRGWSSSGP